MNKDSDYRIENITHNLLPTTGLKDRFKPAQTLQERMAYYHTPGVSVAVINDFEVEWAQGFGVCDARTNRTVNTETLFQAGSISKPIFAMGVMRLVEEGKLNLDEDIHRYLTSWHVPANDGWQPRITLRQILSHSAGLTVRGFPGYQASEPLPNVPQILSDEYPAHTGKVEVNILPGTQFRYSGGGTTIAQQALVDHLKKPFPKIMSELVLERCGMTNSTFKQPLPKAWAKRAATAHPWKGIPLKGRFRTYPEMAAAGLWTTATDLAKAGVELLKILHGKEARGLLTKESVEMMLTPQLAHQKVGDGLYVGLGFFCDGKEDDFSFGHVGWDEGFVAQMQVFKALGKGAVVMINSNEGDALIDEIFRAIGMEYGWPNAMPKEKTSINLANSGEYSGVYSTKDGTQFRVDLSDGKLTLNYGEQPALPIDPSTENEFFTRVLNTDIRFERDEKGNIVSLTLIQDGNQIEATKQNPSKM